MTQGDWGLGATGKPDQLALDFGTAATTKDTARGAGLSGSRSAPGLPGQLSLWDVDTWKPAVLVPQPAKPRTADALARLKEEALACQKCGLREGCKGVVFGEGDPAAGLLLVGEGPGQVEDETGRPFVGAAGNLLDRILEAVGLRREEVYIANVVKCRPPQNRVPMPEERAACRPWLDRQIELIDPDVIICLGASAAQVLLGEDLRITQARGRWFEYTLTPTTGTGEGEERVRHIKVMPTFHPAAILRDPSKRRPVWEDFKLVKAALARA